MYRAIEVWDRRANGELVCYRCLEVLPDGGFCVQSADFYRQDQEFGEQDMMFGQQFIELLREESPEQRAVVLPTLREAIERHQKEFGTT
jgi:hypothetical protein